MVEDENNHLISETAFPRTYLTVELYFYGGGKQIKLKNNKKKRIY